MLKKILTITIILLMAIGMLVGGYYLVVKTVEIITGPETPGPKAEAPAPDKLKELSDKPVFDYWVVHTKETTSTPATTSYYYLTSAGEILEAKEDIDNSIAAQPIKDLQAISPSRDGSLVLVSYGSKLFPQWSILNVLDRSWQPLPLNVRSAHLSPNGTQLALLIATNGKSDLTIQDITLQPKAKKLASRKVLSLYQKGLSVQWLMPDKIILAERPSDISASSIWQVDIKTAAIMPLIGETSGLMVQWAENGSRGVKYNTGAEATSRLSVINNKGETINNLNFISPPDKCVFIFDTLWCSIPTAFGGQKLATLLDSYLKKNIYFSDMLFEYRQDSSGAYSSTRGISYGKPIDATHLTVLDNELLFINRLDQKLYKLEL